MTFDAEIENVRLLDHHETQKNVFQSAAKARVQVDVSFKRDVQHPVFALIIRTPDGRVIYDTTTHRMEMVTPVFKAGERCRIEYELDLPLLEGTYELGVDITPSDMSHFYDCVERALTFTVVGARGAKGLVDLGAQVSFNSLDA